MTVIACMEVPRRPQPPTFTLALSKPASSPPSGASGAAEKADPMKEELREKRDGAAEKGLLGEDKEPSVPVIVEPEDASAVEADAKLSSQDSFSEESAVSEESVLEEAKRKLEEEEAAAKERATQRQLLAIEELVQSERNYLRLLQVSTVTIRSNLQKLQVQPTWRPLASALQLAFLA